MTSDDACREDLGVGGLKLAFLLYVEEPATATEDGRVDCEVVVIDEPDVDHGARGVDATDEGNILARSFLDLRKCLDVADNGAFTKIAPGRRLQRARNDEPFDSIHPLRVMSVVI